MPRECTYDTGCWMEKIGSMPQYYPGICEDEGCKYFIESSHAEQAKASFLERIVSLFWRKPYIVRPYTVIYPLSYGAMCIHEGRFDCFACSKYHAFLQFIKGTKGEDHYSDRSQRTPRAFLNWVGDIKEGT